MGHEIVDILSNALYCIDVEQTINDSGDITRVTLYELAAFCRLIWKQFSVVSRRCPDCHAPTRVQLVPLASPWRPPVCRQPARWLSRRMPRSGTQCTPRRRSWETVSWTCVHRHPQSVDYRPVTQKFTQPTADIRTRYRSTWHTILTLRFYQLSKKT